MGLSGTHSLQARYELAFSSLWQGLNSDFFELSDLDLLGLALGSLWRAYLCTTLMSKTASAGSTDVVIKDIVPTGSYEFN